MKKKIVIASFFSLLAFGSAFGAVRPLVSTAVDPVNGFSEIEERTIAGKTVYVIKDDLTLSSSDEYILEGFTFVEAGNTLSIAAGTILRGQPLDGAVLPGSLVVSRGAKICAVGEEDAPIIFTTAANAANRGRWTSGAFLDSDPKNNPLPPVTYSNPSNPTAGTGLDNANLWGAVTILGYAPINTNASVTGIAGEDIIEGFDLGEPEELTYGGSNPHDSSGTLKYVSIRYTGRTANENDEQQGLTLGGVGNGTTLEHLDIFVSGDDGIEIFGGTVNISNFVISYADDDGLDIDQGYTGAIQFGLIIGSDLPLVPSSDPNATQPTGLHSDYLAEWDGDDDISADGFNVSLTGAPFAYPSLHNLTFVGPRGTGTLTGAIRARQGFGGEIRNSIFVNLPAGQSNFRIDNTGTGNAAAAGYLSVLSGNRVVLGTHNYAGTLWYNVSNNTVATIGHEDWSRAVLNNGTSGAIVSSGSALNQVAVNPGLNDLDQTWGEDSFNPVPAATNTTGNAVYIDSCSTPCSILPVEYIGAFEPVSGPLWTTGWTALNQGNVLVNAK